MQLRKKVIVTFWISLSLALLSLLIFANDVPPIIAIATWIGLAVAAAVCAFYVWFGVKSSNS